jgi:hypothetical protein
MPASDDLFLRADQPANLVKNGMSPSCLVFSHTQDRIEEAALFEDFGRCLVETIRSTPGVKWRIRLHPAEDDSFYRELEISRFQNVEISARDISLEQAVEAASVVCTIRSTAGLQAMMLQKPLIVLNLASLSGPPVAWPIHGGGLYAKNADEFGKNLARLISDETFRCSLLASQSAFLDKTFANRGRAAATIVDYLEEQTAARAT